MNETVTVEEAKTLVSQVLSSQPDRLAHTLAVGERMGELYADASQAVRSSAIVAGILHDIGYGCPVVTGHHAIDGAVWLEARGGLFARFASLVAWHSTSKWEATERGLIIPFPEPVDVLMSRALWVSDFTVSPTGEPCDYQWRLDNIRSRYEPDSPVIRALDASQGSFDEALRTVRAWFV